MAKSYNNLWQKMISLDNIERAIHRAAKGKRQKHAVQYAEANIPATVERIKGMLESGEWTPPKVREGRVYKDNVSQKTRILVCPDFEEQIIHHLLIDFIIEPIFKPTFFEWSCGSIPGRGQEGMGRHIQNKINRCGNSLKWGAVLDIRKCFQSIDTKVIYKAIARKIRDQKVLEIVRKILESNTIKLPDGTILTGGVPIGLFTSPWFVNIALNHMDHKIKDNTILYVRYIDDMLLLHSNQRKLRKTVKDIVERLAKMGMHLKNEKNIFRFGEGGVENIRFTGFHITKTRMCVRDRVFLRARRVGARIRRKLHNKIRVTAYDAERIISYGGRFRAFGSYAAFGKEVLKGIEFSRMRRKVAVRNSLESKNRERD